MPEVTIKLPRELAKRYGLPFEMTGEGDTVDQCMALVFSQQPELKEDMLDAEGELSTHWLVLVNKRTAYPERLQKPVRNGDLVQFIQALTGG